jgi:hypothetical protein
MEQWDVMAAALGGSGAVRAAGNQEATTAAASPPHSPHDGNNSFIAAASSTAASPSPIRRLRVQGVPQAQLIQGLHNLREHSKAKIIIPKNLMNLREQNFLNFVIKYMGFNHPIKSNRYAPRRQ